MSFSIGILSCLSSFHSRFFAGRLFSRGVSVIAATAAFIAGPSAAQNLPPELSAAIARAKLPAGAVGIDIRDAANGTRMLELNAGQPFSPASTMKLVTTFSALDMLGPTFIWKTQAFAAGRMEGDMLQGDLVFKGSGDPKLVMENFWLFLRQIRAAGIRDIRGNVLLDRSVFEPLPHDASQFDGDPMKPYNAGPDALLLNYQSFRFRFSPDEASGTVKVTVDPPAASYKVVKPQLSRGACGDWQGGLKAGLVDVEARFAGTYAAACGERNWYIHPPLMSPTRYFSMVFRQMWADLGGTLAGEVIDGTLPSGARQVAEWESPVLAEVIRDINKYSNNVMARQTLLTLGAAVGGIPGSPQRGAQVVKSWMAEKGIEAPELVIENGSGLSRNERIAPRTMARLLQTAFTSPLMPEFMSSLPLAGYDGTMKRRLNGKGVAGRAHIKTGSLDNVRAIAGYVLAASGRRYAVVCIINHPNAAQSQGVTDALIEWVYANG